MAVVRLRTGAVHQRTGWQPRRQRRTLQRGSATRKRGQAAGRWPDAWGGNWEAAVNVDVRMAVVGGVAVRQAVTRHSAAIRAGRRRTQVGNHDLAASGSLPADGLLCSVLCADGDGLVFTCHSHRRRRGCPPAPSPASARAGSSCHSHRCRPGLSTPKPRPHRCRPAPSTRPHPTSTHINVRKMSVRLRSVGSSRGMPDDDAYV